MLLAVDIGNSRIKFGVYDGELLIQKLSFPTSSDFQFAEITEDITSSLICSVVPTATDRIVTAIGDKFSIEPTVVRNDFDFGLTVMHTPLETIGTDRLINSFSAVEKYDVPCIVCSVGTALTIDYVDENKVMRGGVIAPGMKMFAKALHTETSQLPEVEIKSTDTVLQRTTVGALQSGVVNGFVGLFDSLISDIKSEISDPPRVIATGGDAAFVAENTKSIDVVDENLLLDGLQKLHRQIQ